MHKILRHSAGAILEGGLIAVIAIGLVAGSALAAKPTAGGSTGGSKHGGGGTTTGSISVVMVTDNDHNGAANWNDQVTYDVSKVGVQNPFITTTCTQNGSNVLTTYAGYYPGYIWSGAQTISLSTELWTSGSASCKAVVQNTSIVLNYSVGA
jgi:hypothetical protein